MVRNKEKKNTENNKVFYEAILYFVALLAVAMLWCLRQDLCLCGIVWNDMIIINVSFLQSNSNLCSSNSFRYCKTFLLTVVEKLSPCLTISPCRTRPKG